MTLIDHLLIQSSFQYLDPPQKKHNSNNVVIYMWFLQEGELKVDI